MKKKLLCMTSLIMLSGSMICSASGEGIPNDVETWALFNDNQKNLYYAMEEIEEEITGVFEYLGNMTMADGSRAVVDLLFIEAPEAEDGIYVYDTAAGELYDHINHKKVAEEFETMEHCINTLANCYENYANGSEWMWMDSEIKIHMTEEEIDEVFTAREGAEAGNGNALSEEAEETADAADSEQENAAAGSTMSKEEMMTQAIDVEAYMINNESFENFAKAKQTYCNQVMKLKGKIQAIGENYIELGCDSTYVIDVYLPIEEILSLEVGQNVLVVGQTTDEVMESSQNIGGYSFEYVHYQMPTAYLVQDRFEIKGILKGVNNSYAPAFNIQIGDSNYLKLIYFADSVDTSTLEWGQEITFIAKCVKGSLDWEYLDAEIIG